jgi:hypothetical protein
MVIRRVYAPATLFPGKDTQLPTKYESGLFGGKKNILSLEGNLRRFLALPSCIPVHLPMTLSRYPSTLYLLTYIKDPTGFNPNGE